MDEIRIKAKQDYLSGMKQKEICEKYNISINTLKSWIKRYRWSEEKKNYNNKGAPKKKRGAPLNNENAMDHEPKENKIIDELEDVELTEMQRLFCLYYIKSFNATQSAIKAGYSKESAHVIGHENLRKPNIVKEIKRLKGNMTQDIFIDAMDVLRKYIEIAFADVTDYLKFGQKEVPVMSMFGPVLDEDGEPVTKIINYVDLKESDEIDGTILSEVSQGKDGVKIKLLDKMKALEKLELYFDLLPDKFKRQLEEEKLKLQRDKLNIDKKEKPTGVTIVDDIEGEEDES